LVFDATDDDWHTSLQCPSDDLDWVVGTRARKDGKITARDQAMEVWSSEDSASEDSASKDSPSEGGPDRWRRRHR
jgi:hypothetical protein